MASRLRKVEPGHIYHVLNRGVQRQLLFSSDQHYIRFDELIEESLEVYPLQIFTYELMPNHWHFVVRPKAKDDLSGFFHLLSGTHGRRFRVQNGTTGQGHVYQDRFKSIPVEGDGHFLALCRYVERNALRAGLVSRAEDWRWSGLYRRITGTDQWLVSDWPVPRPDDWIERVNRPMTNDELREIRQCIARGRPFGSPQWTRETAKQLGLEHTLRPRGRPPIARRR
jgi:putative transposase